MGEFVLGNVLEEITLSEYGWRGENSLSLRRLEVGEL